jgi:hypothetical protein
MREVLIHLDRHSNVEITDESFQNFTTWSQAMHAMEQGNLLEQKKILPFHAPTVFLKSETPTARFVLLSEKIMEDFEAAKKVSQSH